MKTWAVCIAVMLHALCASAETLVVGLPEPGRRPYFWQDPDKQVRGSYITLLKRIGEISGATFEFRMVPQSRLISEFDGGKIDIEPGIAPDWRPSARDVENSRYTQAFMHMNDVFIMRKGLPLARSVSIQEVQKQADLRIGQVRGFHVPGGLKATFVYNELDIARLVSSAALDIGFMNERVAVHLKEVHGFQYEISAPISSAPVSLRISQANEKWVEPFNRAISQIRNSGELKKLFPE